MPDEDDLKTMRKSVFPAHHHVRKTFLDKDLQKLLDGAMHNMNSPIYSFNYSKNGLLNAVLTAFHKHLPLRLRPQDLWLAITQSLAIHIDKNAEKLRDRFVKHNGQMKLELFVDDEVHNGLKTSDWEHIISQFMNLINKNTVENVPTYFGCQEFSQTNNIDIVANGMTTMHACKSYFDYRMRSKCGFPKITLEGIPKDWKLLQLKVAAILEKFALPEFGQKWLVALDSVLSQFSTVAQNPKKINVEFWESMAKIGGSRGSGASTWVNGWINVFFPYLSNNKENPFCIPFQNKQYYALPDKKYDWKESKNIVGPSIHEFTDGLCSTPVTLDGFPLDFRAGFIGVQFNEQTTEVAPHTGWFVAAGQVPERVVHNGRFSRSQPDIKEIDRIYTNIGKTFPLMDYVKNLSYQYR